MDTTQMGTTQMDTSQMDTSQIVLIAEARVSTSMPRRYLHQLCKHFQHKLPVTLDDWQGRIEFAAGICELDAATIGGVLQMRVTAAGETELAWLQDVVARHLERFAFRDEIKIQWTRSI
jgi:hypothetical protein